MAKRPVSTEDCWNLKTVSDVQLSQDGKTVAYVVGSFDEKDNKAHSAIWLADVATGEARQFTTGESGDSQPRWSLDGSRLALVSSRHEGKPQVFVMNVNGGEPRRVTSAETMANTPVWSPDGKRLCYSSMCPIDDQKVSAETNWFEQHSDADQKSPRLRRQGKLGSREDGRGYIESRLHLFVIDVDDPKTEPRQLTDGNHDDTEPAWSPDGALIAFMSNRTAEAEHNRAFDVWAVDVESGDCRALTNGDLTARGPIWSPDGQTVAFYGRPEWIATGYQDTHLWSVSRQGGDQRELSGTLDQNCGGSTLPDYMLPDMMAGPSWSPDGNSIYFLAADHGDEAIHVLTFSNGQVRRVSPTGCCTFRPQCTPDGLTLICQATSPTEPFDVFMLPTGGGEIRRITATNAALLNEVELAPTENIKFKGPDGWDIEGWLVRPLDTGQPYPLIVNVHGGPFAAWGNIFYFKAQSLAGAGYASLYLNPRGSNGYGFTFARAADWGEKDYLDIMAGVDAVVAMGHVDPNNLGITGISYGGFMTNWVVGHTDRFSAAVSINGIASQFSMHGVSDIAALWFEQEFHGSFWTSEEQWQLYRHRSPISYVENVSTPLLLLQSENDYRCPIAEGEQMLTALRIRKQTVELIRFPNCSHVIAISGQPHQRYMQWKLSRDWFDAYCKGGDPAKRVLPSLGK